MKKIGIFYICTGPYKLFWEDFYNSAEQYFLQNIEKHYFIFTDDVNFISYKNSKIHLYHIDNLPWPLITLFRFRYFLSVKDDLIDMDYLMFSNSNMKFVSEVTAEEFLPREEKNESLFFTLHPGYINAKPQHKPFDRNKNCSAYLPYNYKGPYVIGAMNGGTKDAFLLMANTLNKNIEEDLKHNIIATWHDESQINKYISINNKYRILPPSYCYPCGFEVTIEKKIIAVSKDDKFNIRKFKGTDVIVKSPKIKKLISKFKLTYKVIKSHILREKVF